MTAVVLSCGVLEWTKFEKILKEGANAKGRARTVFHMQVGLRSELASTLIGNARSHSGIQAQGSEMAVVDSGLDVLTDESLQHS